MDAKTACVFINGLLFISPNGFVAVVSAAERPTIKKDSRLGNELTVPSSARTRYVDDERIYSKKGAKTR